MSEAHEKELRRLTEALREMATAAQSPKQVEALRKAAAALCVVFAKGSWQELDQFDGPLTEQMSDHLRRMGLDPKKARS